LFSPVNASIKINDIKKNSPGESQPKRVSSTGTTGSNPGEATGAFTYDQNTLTAIQNSPYINDTEKVSITASFKAFSRAASNFLEGMEKTPSLIQSKETHFKIMQNIHELMDKVYGYNLDRYKNEKPEIAAAIYKPAYDEGLKVVKNNPKLQSFLKEQCQAPTPIEKIMSHILDEPSYSLTDKQKLYTFFINLAFNTWNDKILKQFSLEEPTQELLRNTRKNIQASEQHMVEALKSQLNITEAPKP